jgi:hypothetical protein
VRVAGGDFVRAGESHIAAFKACASEMGVSIWYSCNVNGEEPPYDKRNIPMVMKDYADNFEVIVVLDPKPDHIAFTISRLREKYNPEHLALRLDPKTLLMLEN